MKLCSLRCSTSISFSSFEKIGYGLGSTIMAIKFLQSISKFWHVEYRSIFSIAKVIQTQSEKKSLSLFDFLCLSVEFVLLNLYKPIYIH